MYGHRIFVSSAGLLLVREALYSLAYSVSLNHYRPRVSRRVSSDLSTFFLDIPSVSWLSLYLYSIAPLISVPFLSLSAVSFVAS